MNKTILIVIGVLIIGGVGAWASGVFKEKVSESIIENTIESQSGDDVDVDLDLSGEETTINVNGSTLNLGTDVDLPSDFPNDVYIPDDAEILAVANIEVGAYTVSMTSDRDVADLRQDYETQQSSDGWVIGSTITVGEGVSLIWEKNDRMMSVNIIESDDGTTAIGLSVGSSS
ncbi:MAG: hypothetical protein WCV86_03645 [Patescibacteria group bacterium]|jgi:hypothetical protein